MGGRIIKQGLNWPVLESKARAYKVPWNGYVLDRLEICEQEILEEQNAQLESERKDD